MREVLFFANGDPESAQTWSNVPKCFVDTLRRKGVVVHTVNLANERLQKAYDLGFRRVLKVLTMWYDEPRYYGYTWLHKLLGYRRIKHAVKAFPDVDYCFFINYPFYNKFSQVPSLLLSDWPNIIDLRRRGKPMSRFKRRFCLQEKEAIEHARHVVSIFPLCAQEMCELYPSAHISYLGGNVINNLSGKVLAHRGEVPDDAPDVVFTDTLMERKRHSRRILFVGKPDRYRESAVKLIEAVGLMRKEPQFSDLELDVVGISAGQLPKVPPYVRCHGFLHKDVPGECALFYDLLMNAKVIVNPTPRWAAYSSIVEAMYFMTPVVVSAFDDFVKEFGSDIPFGCYNREFTAQGIADSIKSVIGSPRYDALCERAHETVKGYTWDVYVDKVLRLCNE